MIEKHFLFPEYYIHKIPKCDDCKEVLEDMHIELPVYPSRYKFICPKCNKIYEFTYKDLEGEWKWRTI